MPAGAPDEKRPSPQRAPGGDPVDDDACGRAAKDGLSGESLFKALLAIGAVPAVFAGVSMVRLLIDDTRRVLSLLAVYDTMQVVIGTSMYAILAGACLASAIAPLALLFDVYAAPGIRRAVWGKTGKTQWLGLEERSRTLAHLDRAVAMAVAAPLLCFAASFLFDVPSLSYKGLDGPLFIVFGLFRAWFDANLMCYAAATTLTAAAVACAHVGHLFPDVRSM